MVEIYLSRTKWTCCATVTSAFTLVTIALTAGFRESVHHVVKIPSENSLTGTYNTPDESQPALERCAMRASFEAPEESFSWSLHAPLNKGGPFSGSEIELHVAGCNLTAWIDDRVAQVRQCFARLGHVVIAGDSISRNAYISLAHFLHTGRWTPRWGPPSDIPRAWSVERPPNVAVRNGFPAEIDFPRYHANISARMDGFEVCDCYVGTGGHVENRYYARDGVRLSYAQLFGTAHPYLMHDPAWLNASCGRISEPCAQSGCAVGECKPDPQAPHFLRLDFPASYEAVTRLLVPGIVVFNTGLHEPERLERNDGVELVQRLVAATAAAPIDGDLRAAWNRYHSKADSSTHSSAPPQEAAPADSSTAPTTRDTRSRFVWRTTTPFRNEESVVAAAALIPTPSGPQEFSRLPNAPASPWPRRDRNVTAAVLAAGGRVFDASSLIWPLFVQLAATGSKRGTSWDTDRHHMSPAVNAAMNRALIAFLCEDDADWRT